MSRIWRYEVPAALAVALLLATTLLGSIDRGAIQGTVSDQQGAVVPGAKVVVKNVETNVEVTLTTNTAGFYLAPELVPGKYSVHVERQGSLRRILLMSWYLPALPPRQTPSSNWAPQPKVSK